MIRTSIKDFLQKKGLYYPLKYSRLFAIYQSLFKRTEIKHHHREVLFYQSFLPPCKIIFDVGANDGHKTAAFLTLAEKVICCEPDKENQSLLRIRFRNQHKRVIIERKALSDEEGYANLYIHHPGSAFNTLSSKWTKLLENEGQQRWHEPIHFKTHENVPTTTLDELIKKYGRPDFIKLDVEGFEHRVLKGLSQPVPYLSFESLLPEYKEEFQNCLEAIDRLDRQAQFNLAEKEKLILPAWVNRSGLENWLNVNNSKQAFEVIVKMSI